MFKHREYKIRPISIHKACNTCHMYNAVLGHCVSWNLIRTTCRWPSVGGTATYEQWTGGSVVLDEKKRRWLDWYTKDHGMNSQQVKTWSWVSKTIEWINWSNRICLPFKNLVNFMHRTNEPSNNRTSLSTSFGGRESVMHCLYYKETNKISTN